MFLKLKLLLQYTQFWVIQGSDEKKKNSQFNPQYKPCTLTLTLIHVSLTFSF